jgi:molybdate transport system substrate-binding protein
MPAQVEIITTFSGAICSTCLQRDAARELLAFMASPPTADAKRRQGMEPV